MPNYIPCYFQKNVKKALFILAYYYYYDFYEYNDYDEDYSVIILN